MTNSSELDENRFAHFTDEMNIELLLRANAVGQRARDNGDEPFGCLLADIDGNVI